MSSQPIEIVTDVVNQLLSEPHASLLNGIVYGKPIPKYLGLYDKIKHSGLLHLVVLSGSNIAMLGAMSESILKFLPKKLAILTTLCFIAFFTISVGFEPPIVRAAIMGNISLLAVVFNRKATALYSLIVSAFSMAIFWPQWITSVSFLLSYSATLGIILFGAPSVKDPWWFPKEFRISIVAQVFTAPIIFFSFKEISLIAPFSNLLASLVIGPIMFIGVITSILGTVSPILAQPLAFLLLGMLEYLLFIVNVSTMIPYSFISFK